MKSLCRKCFFQLLIRLLIVNLLAGLICWFKFLVSEKVGWDSYLSTFFVVNFSFWCSYLAVRFSDRKGFKKADSGKY